MFNQLNTFLPILSVILSVFAIFGGFVAFRQGYGRTVSGVQKSVIAALQAQNDTQEKQIALYEKEIAYRKRILTTVQAALVQVDMHLEVDGEAVTLIEIPKQKRITLTIKEDESTTPTK